MGVYERTKFEVWKKKKTYITRIILPNYIVYNGDLKYIGTFPVDSGMPVIFTDVQHSTCWRPTYCWIICKYQMPSLGLLEKFQWRSDHPKSPQNHTYFLNFPQGNSEKLNLKKLDQDEIREADADSQKLFIIRQTADTVKDGWRS